MEVLRTEGLKKYYGSPDSPARQVKALDGVSFGVQRGEFVAVVGTGGRLALCSRRLTLCQS